MKVKFFNPGKAYLEIKDEIDATMQGVLERGDLILRGDVGEFERNLAEYVGTEYAIAVASGTDALFLTMKVLGIGKGDEVICPSYTFRATVEAIHMTGATPVLTDLCEDWQKYISPFTKAVIPAHIAGETLNWEPVDGIHMIEDACQAIGAKPVEGIVACYSFYPAKLLGCYGDAGAICTNDKELNAKLKSMRNHHKDTWEDYGWNSRLDNLQAAVLNVKIKKLPQAILRRKQIALQYDEALNELVTIPNIREVYQDYIIETDQRDELHAFLADAGIETMKNGYPFPKHSPKGKKTLAYEERSLRLPCNETLTDEEVECVIEKIQEFYV